MGGNRCNPEGRNSVSLVTILPEILPSRGPPPSNLGSPAPQARQQGQSQDPAPLAPPLSPRSVSLAHGNNAAFVAELEAML